MSNQNQIQELINEKTRKYVNGPQKKKKFQFQQRKRGYGNRQNRVIPFSRRPMYRVMYGQDQDLAFKLKNKRKGVMGPLSAPISESNVIKTYINFSNDTLTLCQPIPANCFQANVAVIPTHPMFFPGRVANIAQNYTNYQVTKAVVSYVPLIGTTSTGQIAITSTRHSTPISYLTTDQFANVTNINANISSVWMCSKFRPLDLDTDIKNMVPMNRNDMSNQFYVVGSGLAGNLNVSCNIFLEMSYKFLKPSPSVEVTSNTLLITYVISAAGIRTSLPGPSSRMNIVLSSTAINIDVGELMITPGFTLIATDYLLNVTHNSSPINYDAGSDQGTVVCISFSVN